MSWKKKYKVVKVKPGRIDTKQYGILDFSRDNIPVEYCDRLVKDGFPYLEPIPETQTDKTVKK